MQRWVRARKVDQMEDAGWKKTDITRADGGQVLMEKNETPAKTRRIRKPKEEPKIEITEGE